VKKAGHPMFLVLGAMSFPLASPAWPNLAVGFCAAAAATLFVHAGKKEEKSERVFFSIVVLGLSSRVAESIWPMGLDASLSLKNFASAGQYVFSVFCGVTAAKSGIRVMKKKAGHAAKPTAPSGHGSS